MYVGISAIIYHFIENIIKFSIFLFLKFFIIKWENESRADSADQTLRSTYTQHLCINKTWRWKKILDIMNFSMYLKNASIYIPKAWWMKGDCYSYAALVGCCLTEYTHVRTISATNGIAWLGGFGGWQDWGLSLA